MSPLNVKSYCLSLYGCPLWNLSSSTINLINIAYNKILRKLWCLPRHSHRRIVHCVAETTCITNLICKRFFAFYKKALLGSYLVRSVYYKSSILCYTFTGYNVCAGEDHLFSYQPNDYIMSNIVRTFRCVYGSKSPFEDVIRDNNYFLFINYILIILHFCCCLGFSLHLNWCV